MTCPPTFSRVPDGDEATGQEAVDLAKAYGVALDDWQADVIRGVLRERAGTWAASQVGLVVGRQNGKGQILLALELFGLLVLKENILHTAHAVKTSSDAFRRLWAVLQAHDDLARLVGRHSQQIGMEYVELINGARIAFTTRSASAGRGLSVDRLVVDEAEDLPAAEVGALAPTVFARPSAQSLYVGTAPGTMHDAEAFTTMRRTAHDGLNPRLAWWEWCAEYGSNIDDRELWVKVNPAVASGRVDVQAIIDDRAILPADQFRAERLSMFMPTGGTTVFDPDEWLSLADETSVPVTRLSLGIDTPPSRDATTICLAGLRADDKLHVEWYTTAPGVVWLPEWLKARPDPRLRAVVVDNRNAAAEVDWGSLHPTLLNGREMSAASGRFFDVVAERTLRHRGQVELTRGVLGAKQRPMMGGESFGWDRKAPGSSVLIAATLALWGVEADKPTRPVRAAKPQRVVVLS